MGFIEYYKTKCNKAGSMFIWKEEMPEDIYKDLMNLLAQEDKRIGIMVFHSHKWNEEHTQVEFNGLKIGYYVRAKFPHLIFNDYGIPCGIRFWQMKRVNF